MMTRAVVRGVGHYLPERVVENAEFAEDAGHERRMDPQPLGIERRHFAAPGEGTSDLAAMPPARRWPMPTWTSTTSTR